MNANEIQVGGTHYKDGGSFQHWDLVSEWNIGYLEGYATKYLFRWEKTETPLKDLTKSFHVTQKLMELARQGIRSCDNYAPDNVIESCLNMNKVRDEGARRACMVLLGKWGSPGTDENVLGDAAQSIQILIESVRQQIEQGLRDAEGRVIRPDVTGQKHPFGFDSTREA